MDIATAIAQTVHLITVIAMDGGITVMVIITAVYLAATKVAEEKIDMIKEPMHDPIFLEGKSAVATKEDLHAAEELVKLGYTNIKEFGGIIDWKYEIVK